MMMRRLNHWCATMGLCVWACAVVAQEAPDADVLAERAAERARIAQARQAIAAEQTKAKAACYQRFAVEDCIRAAHAKAREAEVPLKAREMLINDVERKEKAAGRVKSIEERQTAAAAQAAASHPPSSTVRQDPADLAARRGADAQRRSQEQRSREQSHAKEQPQKDAAQAARAADVRERHEQALKAAAERKQRMERQQAEDAAAGRKPAPPLPSPSSSR